MSFGFHMRDHAYEPPADAIDDWLRGAEYLMRKRAGDADAHAKDPKTPAYERALKLLRVAGKCSIVGWRDHASALQEKARSIARADLVEQRDAAIADLVNDLRAEGMEPP